MSCSEPGQAYLPAAPGLRLARVTYSAPELAMLSLQLWVDRPDSFVHSEPIIGWHIVSAGSPVDDVVRPLTLSGERGPMAETLEGVVHPSGRVDVSLTLSPSHGGVFDNLGEFFRKGVELAEQKQRTTAKGGAR